MLLVEYSLYMVSEERLFFSQPGCFYGQINTWVVKFQLFLDDALLDNATQVFSRPSDYKWLI